MKVPLGEETRFPQRFPRAVEIQKLPETAWETRQSSTFIFPFQPAKATLPNTRIDGLLGAMLQ